MPTDKWDDGRIEDLLSEFPTIRDERPKEEVYNRLAKENPVRQKPKRMIPYLIAALAFITFGVLITSLISQNGSDSAQYEQAEDSANHSTAIQESSGGESAETEIMEEGAAEESADFSMVQIEEPATAAVYPDDLDGSTLFTIGLTENAYVIPVSFLIPDEQISEEFGKENPDSVDLYNRYAAEIDEEALGFDDYHPYEGSLEKTADSVNHILPEEHPYDMASAAIEVYRGTMAETFKESGEIAVFDESGQTAEFSQVGPMEPFSASAENLAYFAVANDEGENFLSPGYGMPFDSAEEAIRAMRTSPSDFQQSVVPENITFTINETEDSVEIEFEEPVEFEKFNEKTVRHMIEGLALTADSFGKSIKFINTGTDQWNSYDFTGEIEAPIAVNRLEWNGR